jgi:hypothetical protein
MGIDYEQFFKEEIYYTEFRNSNYQIAVVRNLAGTLERIAAELKLGTHETIRWIFRVHSERNCEMCQLSHALIKLQNSKCPTSHWKFISVLIQSPSVSISNILPHRLVCADKVDPHADWLSGLRVGALC